MPQKTFSLTKAQIEFLRTHKQHGFQDMSAMVRTAITNLQEALEPNPLRTSAALYAIEYENDADLQSLTERALGEWPA